ncbi:hypothetical protein [Chondromyces crocatus]|uniref:hypothetical protein n=1 Tax=Chondromyces crocatus TaxID=52 RepID=UPI0012E2078E|nr:hypothetical protein [Chondromyces crocatus]
MSSSDVDQRGPDEEPLPEGEALETRTVRVRFAAGVMALPASVACIRLPEDAILRWRAMTQPPSGDRRTLGEIAPGECVVVGVGGSWEQGVALGTLVRPGDPGRWVVEGDVRDYASIAEAEQEHGALLAGEAWTPAAGISAAAVEDGPSLGDPVTVAELAVVLGCAVDEVEAQVASLPRSSYLRFVQRALASRADMATAP